MCKKGGRQLLGILLILIGVVWALRNLDIFSFEFEYLYLSWPFFLMIIGLLIIIRSKGSFGGFVVFFVGGAFFLSRMYGYSIGMIFREFWPLILIAVGISILLEYWREKPKKEISGNRKQTAEDYLDVSTILSEDKIQVTSQNLKGGKITTVMGASKIDLLSAKPDKNCVFDVLTIMGGTEIYIPSNWKVRNDITSLFGGTDESKRRSVPTEGSEQPEVFIKGFVMFGGLEIKS